MGLFDSLAKIGAAIDKATGGQSPSRRPRYSNSKSVGRYDASTAEVLHGGQTSQEVADEKAGAQHNMYDNTP
jgi:hypothetical protein